MKKVVIAGSTSLQNKINKWINYWKNKGYEVIDYPKPIIRNFEVKYPKIYREFMRNLKKADVLFIMNETKNNIDGYIGAETFAELSFGVILNQIDNKNIDIFLLQEPSSQVQSYDEINLWLKLGWIKTLN